jgi:4-carboxymuconolactone decarboxylase
MLPALRQPWEDNMQKIIAGALALGSMAAPALAEGRFATLTPEQMSPEQRRVYDGIVSGPRGGAATGPFNAWLRSPETGDRLQRVGAHLRFQSSIPRALNELAILITAREWNAQYEWYAHHRMAMEAGLPPAIAEDLRHGRRPEVMNDDQRIIYEFCIALHRTRNVSDEQFNAVKARFGEQGVVDLIAVSGYYVAVSMTLNVAGVGLPPGVEPPLPPLAR